MGAVRDSGAGSQVVVSPRGCGPGDVGRPFGTDCSSGSAV